MPTGGVARTSIRRGPGDVHRHALGVTTDTPRRAGVLPGAQPQQMALAWLVVMLGTPDCGSLV